MEKLTKARTATFYEKISHKLVWKNFKEKNQYNLYALSWVSVRKDNRPLIQNNSLPASLNPWLERKIQTQQQAPKLDLYVPHCLARSPNRP